MPSSTAQSVRLTNYRSVSPSTAKPTNWRFTRQSIESAFYENILSKMVIPNSTAARDEAVSFERPPRVAEWTWYLIRSDAKTAYTLAHHHLWIIWIDDWYKSGYGMSRPRGPKPKVATAYKLGCSSHPDRYNRSYCDLPPLRGGRSLGEANEHAPR